MYTTASMLCEHCVHYGYGILWYTTVSREPMCILSSLWLFVYYGLYGMCLLRHLCYVNNAFTMAMCMLRSLYYLHTWISMVMCILRSI